MNCLIYVRVSADKQVEKELSLPAQLQACRQYASERCWQIVEEFIKTGVSARTADRPELKRLLARCRERELVKRSGTSGSSRSIPKHCDSLWRLHQTLSLAQQRELLCLVFADLSLNPKGIAGYRLTPLFTDVHQTEQTAA